MHHRTSRRTPTGWLLVVVSVGVLGLAAACDDAQEPPDSGATATVTYESVETEGACEPAPDGTACSFEGTDNNLIVEVSGEWTATDAVAVEYWNDEAGRFRTQPVPVEDGSYEASIARLRAETPYEFRVVGLAASGEELPGPTGTFETGTLPPGLRRATFDVVEGAPSSELTFMDFNPKEFEGEALFTGLIAIDGDGEIVWYAETGETNALAQRDNGNLVYLDYESGLREITPLGEEVATLDSECVPIVFHHEVELLPDGSVLTLSFDVRDIFDDPERLQVGDTIWQWDPESGDAEEVWSLHDVEDPAENRTDSSAVSEGFMWKGCDEDLPTEDWSHANSVKRTPDGAYLFSSRHLNQLHEIAPDFGAVEWRLGGEGSDFTFDDPGDRFYHQHSARHLDSGNVLLFDNGNFRPDDEGGQYSRALELELDFDTMTARKVWEYRPDPGIFSPCCASVERLDNGNTLMIFPGDIVTADPCCRPQTIVEADATGRTAWKLEARASGLEVVYRVYAADSILGEVRADDPMAAGGGQPGR